MNTSYPANRAAKHDQVAADAQQAMNDALIVSVRCDNLLETKRLLVAGANPNCIDGRDMQTPLAWVVGTNNPLAPELINALMVHGADPNFVHPKSLTRSSPFMGACVLRHRHLVEAMMDAPGPIKVDLFAGGANQVIPSMVISGSLPEVNLMARLQANFEKTTVFESGDKADLCKGKLWLSIDKNGQNAFMNSTAVENQQWIIKQDFIDRKELLEIPDHQGRTALWLAVERIEENVVEFLLGCGARTDITSHDVETLLGMAKRTVSVPAAGQLERIVGRLQAVDAAQAARSAVEEVVAHHGLRP